MNKLIVSLLLLLGIFQDEPPVELKEDRVPATVTDGSCLIQNGTYITMSSRGTLRGDLLIQDGRIVKVGGTIQAPAGIKVRRFFFIVMQLMIAPNSSYGFFSGMG